MARPIRTTLTIALAAATVSAVAPRAAAEPCPDAPEDLPGREALDGANPLGVPREEFCAAQVGVELIQSRRYTEALEVFEEAGVRFPDSPLGPVGRHVAYQVWMWEDYGDRWEDACRGEHREAEARFARVRDDPDRRAWHSFLEAVHAALEAWQMVRDGRGALPVVNRFWDVVELLRRVERLAPGFADAGLGPAFYDYWIAVFRGRIPGLRGRGPDRAGEAVAAMERVRDEGLLVGGGTSLALVYVYAHEERWEEALAECARLDARWPGSPLTAVLSGRVRRASGAPEAALADFDRALALEPGNGRARLERGRTWATLGDDDRARADLLAFVGDGAHPRYEAWARVELARIDRRAGRFDDALAHLARARELDPRRAGLDDEIQATRKARADADGG